MKNKLSISLAPSCPFAPSEGTLVEYQMLE